jgi:predicted DNA-binding transcriptional regulator YafY
MRADRVLSLLLLLQTRGRMTAQALADELEVSVRTVYRDIDALSAAGVPVYADRGPGGGCALVDSYRTQLTGLREREVRALFMANVPAALADLGLGADLRAALLKLLAALPAARQEDEAWVRQRIFLDWERWQQPEAPGPDGDAPGRGGRAPEAAGAHPGEAGEGAEADDVMHSHLHLLQQAVWHDRRVWISYSRESSFYRRRFDRCVAAYGLVAKEGEWHLVCTAAAETAGEGEDRLRVYKVSELIEVRPCDEGFVRPPGFDLQAAWRSWCAEAQRAHGHYRVTARVSPQMLVDLPLYLREHWDGTTVAEAAPTARSGDNWLSVVLHFDTLEGARTKLLGLGAGIEVETPVALRRSLLDFAEQVVKRYTRH